MWVLTISKAEKDLVIAWFLQPTRDVHTGYILLHDFSFSLDLSTAAVCCKNVENWSSAITSFAIIFWDAVFTVGLSVLQTWGGRSPVDHPWQQAHQRNNFQYRSLYKNGQHNSSPKWNQNAFILQKPKKKQANNFSQRWFQLFQVVMHVHFLISMVVISSLMP